MPIRNRVHRHLYSLDDDTHLTLRAVGKVLDQAGISDRRNARGASAALRWIVRDWERRGGWEHVRELDRARMEGEE